jgi:hypothetical protein
MQLVDGSHGAGLNALSRTLFLALDRRDRAIEDIRVLAPPAPRSEDIARVRGPQEPGGGRGRHVRHRDAEHDRPDRRRAPDHRRHAHRRDGPDGRRAPAPQPRGQSDDGNQGQGQPCGRRSRPRIDIDGGRPVPAAAPPLSDQRLAQCAGRRSPSWENAARAPRTGARAASGGCGQGEGVDRPPVSRWEETRGTGLGATTASLRRTSWRARLTRRLRASVRVATPVKRMEGLTRRGLPAWP